MAGDWRTPVKEHLSSPFKENRSDYVLWVSVHFFNKKLTWEKPFTIKTYRKPCKSNICQTKIRNLLATTQGITGGRLEKVGWTESFNYHKHLIKDQKPLILIMSDSIGKGFHGYIDV